MSDPQEPIEQSNDLTRIKRAYNMACMSLTELSDERTRLAAALKNTNDQCQRLIKAIEGALLLIDQLLAEMRSNGVVPSPQIVAFKAGFDKGMRELLGKSELDEP